MIKVQLSKHKNGIITYVKYRISVKLEYSKEELIGKLANVKHPDNYSKFTTSYGQQSKEKTEWSGVIKNLSKSVKDNI